MDYMARINLIRELCTDCKEYQTCTIQCVKFMLRGMRINALNGSLVKPRAGESKLINPELIVEGKSKEGLRTVTIIPGAYVESYRTIGEILF